jgi:uncharacterized membrane protein
VSFGPVFYILALASAACYGSADFFGGLASRRAHTVAVVVISQGVGLAALGMMMAVLPVASPTHRDMLWGGAAGVAGGIGVALLYRALAIGSMAVVAPITAVCAVVVPVATAIAFGERPGARATTGIAVAIVAIVLVSQQREEARGDGTSTPRRNSIAIAFLSGVAIGLFFLALARTRAEAGMWPLVAARSMSCGLFATIALVMRSSMHMPKSVVGLTVAGGLLDMLANLLYLIASRYGPLSVVVTLSSLYPASTVLLARTVLRERLSGTQVVGIVCALVAVVLIVS